MSVTLGCTMAPLVQRGKHLKSSSDGGESGGNRCKRSYSGAFGGVWRSLLLIGVWSQAVGFVVVRVAESGFSRREHVFTFNLLCTEVS
jgi:hypothetical protein